MHLRQILKSSHLALGKDAPVSRPIQRTGVISSCAILGGKVISCGRVSVEDFEPFASFETSASASPSVDGLVESIG